MVAGRLVVLGAEVGGRCSETSQFLVALAAVRARDVPEILQGRAKAAHLRRCAILACRERDVIFLGHESLFSG